MIIMAAYYKSSCPTPSYCDPQVAQRIVEKKELQLAGGFFCRLAIRLCEPDINKWTNEKITLSRFPRQSAFLIVVIGIGALKNVYAAGNRIR